MDKETLSNYGWIVICVLVLAVMIALAGPFGNFVSEAVQSTTKGLFDVNKNALNAAGVPGLTVEDQEFDVPDMNHGAGENGGESNVGSVNHNGAVIPEGATYTKADGTVLNSGNEFPSIGTGDKYVYGDYEYRYNQYYTTDGYWETEESQNGWGVIVTDNSKTEYTPLISSINNKPITSLALTYDSCQNLRSVTYIPDSVTDMDKTFRGCKSLTAAPTIPSAVTYMDGTFYDCVSLTNISYEGTLLQWDSIYLFQWNENVPATYVQCSDGTVSLS